jgi:hypothetical protein
VLLDTAPAAQHAQIAAVRRAGPEARLALAVELSEAARAIAIEGELRRHPERSPEAARRAVLERLWGPALAARMPHRAR